MLPLLFKCRISSHLSRHGPGPLPLVCVGFVLRDGPGLNLAASEQHVEDGGAHVDGGRNPEDFPPALHGVLTGESVRITSLSPTVWQTSDWVVSLTSLVKYPVTMGAMTPGMVPNVLVIPSRNPAYLQGEKTRVRNCQRKIMVYLFYGNNFLKRMKVIIA